MTLLSRQDILSAKDIKTQDIEVPEWGGTVRIATLSGTARDMFESLISSKDGMKDIRAKLVAASIVDDKGALMFSIDDVVSLGRKSCSALDRVFNASLTLSAIGNMNVEQLSKN